MEINYTIDENNVIEFWSEQMDGPFIYQPTQPDGTAFASREEAEALAQQLLAGMTPTEEQPTE
jgi:hypothetical protein